MTRYSAKANNAWDWLLSVYWTITTIYNYNICTMQLCDNIIPAWYWNVIIKKQSDILPMEPARTWLLLPSCTSCRISSRVSSSLQNLHSASASNAEHWPQLHPVFCSPVGAARCLIISWSGDVSVGLVPQSLPLITPLLNFPFWILQLRHFDESVNSSFVNLYLCVTLCIRHCKFLKEQSKVIKVHV